MSSESELKKVMVKPGCKHGKDGQYTAGMAILVTQEEFDAFGDKFNPVVTDQPAADTDGSQDDGDPGFDLKTAKMDDVLAAVADGLVTVDEVLAAEEKRSRPRKSLIEALTGGE